MKTAVASLLFVFFSGTCFAGEADLFGDGSQTSQSVDAGTHVVFSGSINMRYVHTGTDLNWKYGGPGITAYGELPSTTEPVSPGSGSADLVTVPRIALVADAVNHSEVFAHVQINYDDLPDTKSNLALGIVEAYGRYGKLDWVTVRAGILIPPVSMEHSSHAWETLYSITPSAMNTWIGEEIRPVAAEFDFRVFENADSKMHFLIAPFADNDPAGAILAFRGWALHDYQYRAGSRLKFSNDVPAAYSSSGWDTPFTDVDGRIGLYGKLDWKTGDQWRFSAFWYDNNSTLGRTPAIDGLDYAWAARFGSLGVEWNHGGPLTAIVQGCYGTARMQLNTFNASSIEYWAGYGLLTWKFNARQRITFRFDDFKVTDLDSTPENNNQTGTAETYAYMYDLAENQTLTAEFVHPDTRRPGDSGAINGDASDDIFQLGYRLLF